MSRQHKQTGYVGRFAPSPTGDLHFGSLVAAVGSYLQARSRRGKWLIRVEDIDPPREVAGSAVRIIHDLARLGLTPDEPVLRQSHRHAAYSRASRRLLSLGEAFPCSCSRGDLPPSGIYPGTCRNGMGGAKERTSIRVRVKRKSIRFRDGVMGWVTQDLRKEVGDFVIYRSDGLPAYQLAVVVDDAFQGITEVVRGADLLDSTPRQIFLQGVLGLPTPEYLHLPVATSPDGTKLSKRHGSDPVNLSSPAAAIEASLRFLGHSPPGGLGLSALWDWAIGNWRAERIPRSAAIPIGNHTVPGQ